MKKNKVNKKYFRVCRVCGKKDETVKRLVCSYNKELFNEEVWEVICEACEYEHLMDI